MEDISQSMFAEGKEITLITDSGQRLVLTIERPFTPFTKSVVLLVRCVDLSPEPVVVKIFDPRFLNKRGDTYTPRTPVDARCRTRSATAYNEEHLWKKEPAVDDVPGQLARAALWEAHFRHLSMDAFESKREAYHRLRHLPGNYPSTSARQRTVGYARRTRASTSRGAAGIHRRIVRLRGRSSSI